MRKFSYIIISLLVIALSTSCGINSKNVNSEITQDSETSMVCNNSIFTKEMLDGLSEIDYWYADEKIAITNKEDIQAIFSEFATLKLTPENNEEAKAGHFIIAFVSSSSTLKVGLLADELIIDADTERYSLDNDITQKVQDIALKNKSSK